MIYIQPTTKQVETFINNNYYVYDEGYGYIVIEETHRNIRSKYKIEYDSNHVSVYSIANFGIYHTKNINRCLLNVSKQILKSILKNADRRKYYDTN